MNLIQILDCNTTLNNCCSSYALINVLDITRKIFSVIQLIAPILLILMTTIQFAQLTINPELKDGFRRILNKVIAAFILFLLPTLVDAVMGLAPDSFTISSCWNSAKRMAEVERGEASFVSIDGDNDVSNSIVANPDTVLDITTKDTSNSNSNNSSKTPSNTSSNAVRKEDIVNYAKKYLGKGYEYGGDWNGEDPYHKTDCSGFIKAVYAHFGIKLPHSSHGFVNSENTYKVSAKEARAGDIVVYNKRHSALLTGNGKQIIHNTSAKGINLYKNYNNYGGVREILRVKGTE